MLKYENYIMDVIPKRYNPKLFSFKRIIWLHKATSRLTQWLLNWRKKQLSLPYFRPNKNLRAEEIFNEK